MSRRTFHESLCRRPRQTCGRAARQKSERHCAPGFCACQVEEIFSARRPKYRHSVCRAECKRESGRTFLIQHRGSPVRFDRAQVCLEILWCASLYQLEPAPPPPKLPPPPLNPLNPPPPPEDHPPPPL